MTFYTRPSTYQIARAPTGLARCRGCKRRVEKGELRISIGAFVRPGRSRRLVRCCACIDAPFANAVLAGAGASAADVAAVRAQLETQASAGLEPQRPVSPSLRRKALEGRREPSLQRVREQPLVLIVPRARGQSKEELSSFLELLKAPRSGKLSDEGSMALRRALDARE
jgi:hypothetical protein